MDIKKIIDDVVKKITSDASLLDKFKADPVKAVEGLVGVDLPDDQIKSVVDGVSAKLAGGAGGIVGKIGDAIGGIFGKK